MSSGRPYAPRVFADHARQCRPCTARIPWVVPVTACTRLPPRRTHPDSPAPHGPGLSRTARTLVPRTAGTRLPRTAGTRLPRTAAPGCPAPHAPAPARRGASLAPTAGFPLLVRTGVLIPGSVNFVTDKPRNVRPRSRQIRYKPTPRCPRADAGSQGCAGCAVARRFTCPFRR